RNQPLMRSNVREPDKVELKSSHGLLPTWLGNVAAVTGEEKRGMLSARAHCSISGRALFQPYAAQMLSTCRTHCTHHASECVCVCVCVYMCVCDQGRGEGAAYKNWLIGGC